MEVYKVNSHKFREIKSAYLQGYYMEGDTVGDSHVDMKGVRYELDKSLDDNISNYMKVSDLISELQALQAAHGDLLVATCDNDGMKSLISKDYPAISHREEHLITDSSGELCLKWFPKPDKVNIEIIVIE